MAVDLQAVVDGIAAMTCVVSVEKLEDGGYGTIRIVTGNRAYIDSIEHPAPGAELLTTEFIPNSEYTRYLTRDLNFEDYCYRAAVHKKCLHSYAHPDRLDLWFNMTFMPLDADEGNLCYCTYTMEINFEPSSERLSNVSGELASHALEIAIKLRSTSDFKHAMSDVIEDIRDICDAEYSCVMLVDEHERTVSVLAERFGPDATELSKKENPLVKDDFYDIAETWENTIAGSNCLVAKNEHDMEVVRERNPEWYASLKDAAVKSIVLFPLKSHGQLLGYIWATNFEADDAGRIKEALELTTYVLAAEIDNYLLLHRLKTLSSRDMLTGVMNRNEMNNRVDALSDGREGKGLSVGILFADLNGLKAVNDEEGHAAGDRLLKNGTSVLAEVFDPNSIYRAGGDEFVVIAMGVSEDELLAKVAAVREAAMRHDNVSFALGHCVAEDCTNVREALRTADARMYEDKAAFYQSTGKQPRHAK